MACAACAHRRNPPRHNPDEPVWIVCCRFCEANICERRYVAHTTATHLSESLPEPLTCPCCDDLGLMHRGA